MSSNGNKITFQVPPGQYVYNVSEAAGYIPSPSFGELDVVNSTTVNITYSPSNLKIALGGLKIVDQSTGASASVLTAGQTYEIGVGLINEGNVEAKVLTTFIISKNSTTFVNETTYTTVSPGQSVTPGVIWTPKANGIYNLSVNAVALPNFSVRSTYDIYVGVHPTVKYNLTFVEYGLPQGTNWSVTLNGTTMSSNGNKITFQVNNGTFRYDIGNPPYFQDPYAMGEINVQGKSITVPAVFLPLVVKPSVNVKIMNSTAGFITALQVNSSYFALITLTNTGNATGTVQLTVQVFLNGSSILTKSIPVEVGANGTAYQKIPLVPSSPGSYTVIVNATWTGPLGSYGSNTSIKLEATSPIKTPTQSSSSTNSTTGSTGKSNSTSSTNSTSPPVGQQKTSSGINPIIYVAVVVVIVIAVVLLLRRR
jgi:hypothetical protein